MTSHFEVNLTDAQLLTLYETMLGSIKFKGKSVGKKMKRKIKNNKENKIRVKSNKLFQIFLIYFNSSIYIYI